jgi:uncharacterized OB-fold protein
VRAEFPLPDTTWPVLQPFWEGAAEGELRIPRCASCGRYEWYPRDTCSGCGGGGLPWAVMSGRATLFSWSEVSFPWVPQFADKVPFVSALAALDEDPSVRLATLVVDADPAALQVDMPLQVTFRPLEFTGVTGSVVAPLFRPT